MLCISLIIVSEMSQTQILEASQERRDKPCLETQVAIVELFIYYGQYLKYFIPKHYLTISLEVIFSLIE